GETLVDTIITNGNTVTINGLDGDLTYQLTETEAPTGYNKMNPDTVDVPPNGSKTFDAQNVENNKGTQLPSTGGIGTTIFYIVGAVLVIGAGVVLVTRRRMNDQ
ncbi:MAG: LPXTG cell wall anchor domain-containing protein, partial [Oscillospiraceae bacterium]|nr:LPXTG cell wall anchor domain-containing protein [Oscillospiraceae bacterium]